jgi:uncharacterized protein (TIRG00374 family)
MTSPSFLGRTRSFLARHWSLLRVVAGVALTLVVLWELYGHGGELNDISSVLGTLRWWWFVPAVMVEAASLVAFCGIEFRLLSAAGTVPPTGSLIGMTLGSQALTNSIPGGPAFAAVYGFRWFRRFGADSAFAVWALIGVAVTNAVTLALVAVTGLALATGEGATLDLVPVIVGVFLVSLGFAALFVFERPLARVVHRVLVVSRRLIGRPRGDVQVHADAVMRRITAVKLLPSDLAALAGWGLANWLLDAACFALSFLAVGAGIPWGALLLAYGAGQLAANLPITPGGLGVVDGSIVVALTYFGGAKASDVAAVFVYRLISFWLMVIAGWCGFGVMAQSVRRGRWPRTVLATRADGPAPEGEPPEALAATPGGTVGSGTGRSEP